MFNYFEFKDTISVNPFRKIRISIEETRDEVKVAELSEVKKLLSYLYEKKRKFSNKNIYSYKLLVRNIATIEILFSTGAKVFELCKLKKEDINFSKDILKEYANLFKDELKDSEYFFIHRINNQISDQSIRFMLKKCSIEANLKQILTPKMFKSSNRVVNFADDLELLVNSYIKNKGIRQEEVAYIFAREGASVLSYLSWLPSNLEAVQSNFSRAESILSEVVE